ncbi:MAG: Rrf2 family transcriptional regulator [Saprospirales bacterium]|nr:MAG: Rrf2 family transcriptional regulator [Saprospirales bacterium]
MFSKACEYSIKAVIYLATRSEQNQRARLPEIAEAIGSPEAFTAKILQELARKKLLISVKGPKGGFELNGDADEISLYKIVEIMDGDSLFHGCALGFKKCSDVHPCPVHNKFKAIRDHLTGVLLTTSIKEAAGTVDEGQSFLTSLK